MAFATTAAACYLIACFALAAWAKLRDFAGFAATVAEIVPALPARAAAGVVIVLESAIALAIGGGMVSGAHIWVVAGATVAIGGAVIFAGAIGAVLRRGDVVACRCFGGDEQTITPASLLGPAIIAAAALIVIRSEVWPASLAVRIASVAAGVHVLIAHRLVLRVASRSHASV